MKGSVIRFTPSERWLHNVVMLTAVTLLLTGAGMVCCNYAGNQGSTRKSLVLIHQYVSVIFIGAPVLLVALGDKRVWRENLRLLTTWGWKDIEWLVKKPVSAIFSNMSLPLSDKFNPGQKTWVTLAVTASKALAVTGAIMWVIPSPILAIMIHTVVGAGLGLGLIGHVYMAVGNKATRPGITSIINGKVDARWAFLHHPLWMEREARRWTKERPELHSVHHHAGHVGMS